MGWWERLPQATRLELMRRTELTRPDDIALLAMENPAYRDAFDRLEKTIIMSIEEMGGDFSIYSPDDFPSVEVLEADEEDFADLVLLALEDGAPDGDEPDVKPRLSKRLPGGATLATYTYAKLRSAVRSLGDDALVADLVGPGLPEEDARRIRLLFNHRLLRLKEDGRLVVDERIGRKGPRYALRYWDDTRADWLDPNRELVAR